MSIKKFKYLFRKSFGFLGVFLDDARCLWKRQANAARILQTAHRIEKGLTVENPRPGWGWGKVDLLAECVERELSKSEPDLFAAQTGAAVLAAYGNAKKHSGYKTEAERAARLLEKSPKTRELLATSRVLGGARVLHADEVAVTGGAEWTEKLFSTRHSLRNFAAREIPRELLLKAVQMALLAPSACNRQPTKVYVLETAKLSEIGIENTYNADKNLVITGEINAFTIPEYGDWVVSSSIFATYLVLALHSLGIGSCIMKKDLHFRSKYNDFLRKTCKIPANEKIILEIVVGFYPETFLTAVSRRKDAGAVVTFC